MKLFDWSEALQQDQLHALTDKQLAKVAGVAGTPLFMPPEALLFLTKARGSTSSRSEEDAGSSSSCSDEASSSSSCSTAHAPAGCGCWGRQRLASGSSNPHRQQHQHQLQHPQNQQAGTLRGLTSTKLDIWGLGTVVYFLLAGRDILQDNSSYDLEDMAELVNASTGIKLPAKTQASPAAHDFLLRALQRDPAQRASAEELLRHPWLAGLGHANDQHRGGMDQHKGVLAMSPQLCLPQSRSSEGQASAYVIAAHHGIMLAGTSSSVPETPVSSGVEVLSDISEYDD
jgi:serine/threonine protein kinase